MTKLNIDKILTRVNSLCWIFLIAVFALKLLGIEIFVSQYDSQRVLDFIDFVDSNVMVRYLINVGKSIFALMLIFYSTIKNFKNYSIYLLAISILYSSVLSCFYLMQVNLHINVIMVIAIYFIPMIANAKIKECVLAGAIDNLVVVISVSLTMLNSEKYSDSYFFYFIMSFDYLLFWIIQAIRRKRGETLWDYYSARAADCLAIKNFVRNLKNTLPCLTCALTKKNLTLLQERLKKFKTHLKIYLKVEFLIDVKKFLIIVFVYSLCLIYGYIIHRGLETAFLCIAYYFIRKLFPKHFHVDHIPNIKKNFISITCVVLTTVTLCAATYSATGISFSIITTILVALFVDFVLFVFRDWLDFKAWYNRKERLSKELLDLGFSKIKIDVAIMHTIDLMTMKEVATAIDRSEQTCKNYFSDVCKVKPELKREK